MGKNTTMAKKNKLFVIMVFIAGVIALFFVNNFTVQPAYDIISCTYNQHACPYATDDWNGICTDEITEQCCEPVDYCNGQLVDNPNDCLHYYCTYSNQYCKPIYQDTGNLLVLGGYKCECNNIEDYPN